MKRNRGWLGRKEALWNLVEGGNCQCSECWRDTSVQQPGMKSWHLQHKCWKNSHLPVAEKSWQENNSGGGIREKKSKVRRGPMTATKVEEW